MHLIEERPKMPLGPIAVANRNDDMLREQAEGHSVEPRIALAAHGSWPGRMLRISAIRFNFPRSHGFATSRAARAGGYAGRWFCAHD